MVLTRLEIRDPSKHDIAIQLQMTISKEMAFYIKERKMQMRMTKCIQILTKCFSPIVFYFLSSNVMILSQKSRQKFNWIFYSKKHLEYFDDEILLVSHYHSSTKL